MFTEHYKISCFISLVDRCAKPQEFRSVLGITKNDIRYHSKYINEYRKIVGVSPPPPKPETKIENTREKTDAIFDDVIKNEEILRRFLGLIDSNATVKQFLKCGVPKDRLAEYLNKVSIYREFVTDDAPYQQSKEITVDVSSIQIERPIYAPPRSHLHNMDVNDNSSTAKRLKPNGFSIIIPTYNRKINIQRALYSIINQKFDIVPIQIIVIDDGSTDGTDEYLKSLDSRILEVYKAHKDEAGWRSPAFAYNEGFKLARYNYIIHYGVDMILMDQGCLQSIYEHCDVDRYLYFMQHRVAMANVEKIKTDSDFFKWVWHYSLPTISTPYPFVAVTSKEAIDKIGGYASGYLAGPGEDDELLEKLKLLNVKFMRIVDHGVSHQDHPSGAKSEHTGHNDWVRNDSVQKLKNKINAREVNTY